MKDLAFAPDASIGLAFDVRPNDISEGGTKLAMQTVRLLLTSKGSHLSDPTYGSTLIDLVGGPFNPTLQEQLVKVALADAGAWLVAATSRYPNSEALRELRYISSSYDGSTLDVAFTILNRAGEQVSITLPVTT